eukprot:CAMPEP_0197271198 /NCGR_PEP_ID=MMETSP1432-20130617/8215_1 /TAXON_ID=44447 /ORGANISM="Pseudo-nitzschia delicatissima, Strain UNC1205" /LENGTH=353 /DNA_ID=CAMNT_0042736595 /DNA_START=112 /DNA_END=1173 /DNA_ORIENTATION=-
MDEGIIMMALSEQEKMRAAAEIHLSRGEALLAAAGGSQNRSLFPQDSYQLLGRGAGYSALNEQLTFPMAMGRTSSVLDVVGSLPDRSLLLGMHGGMANQSNALSGIGDGLGLGSMLRNREWLANAELLSAAESNKLKMERMMMMRRREAMMVAEEKSRMEALQFGMKLRVASTSVVTPGSELDSESTLAALGNSMRKKSSPYVDASAMADPPEFELARRRTRGGVTEPFPEKLHRMLLEIEKDGSGHIISFFPHGRAFGIHDCDKFEEKTMPKYFKQSRLSSFQRQLNLYGFTRIVSGPDSGGYYHELFLKGRPALCTHMRRVGIPKGVDRRKIKSATINKKEPDFYTMRPSI